MEIQTKKIGAFPGKFLPPHLGHVSMIRECAKKCDELWVVVADSKKNSMALCKKANIPSIIIKQGDVIAVAESSRESEKIKSLLELMESKVAPKWLEVDKAKASAKVVALPSREDVDFPFEEHLIVELYSK